MVTSAKFVVLISFIFVPLSQCTIKEPIYEVLWWITEAFFQNCWLACFLCRVTKLCLTENFNREYRLYASLNVQCMIFMWIDCIHWVQKLLYADGLMQLPNLEGTAYFGRYEWKCRTLTFAEPSVCLFYNLFENPDKHKIGSSI